jgi:hypothetical protein
LSVQISRVTAVVSLLQVVVPILLAHGDTVVVAVSGPPALAGIPLGRIRSAVVDVKDGKSAALHLPIETRFLSVLDQQELLGSHLVVDLIDLRLSAGGASLLYRVDAIRGDGRRRCPSQLNPRPG